MEVGVGVGVGVAGSAGVFFFFLQVFLVGLELAEAGAVDDELLGGGSLGGVEGDPAARLATWGPGNV